MITVSVLYTCFLSSNLHFIPMILWRLDVVYYIVLEAFKYTKYAFIPHTIKFPNQVKAIKAFDKTIEIDP
jgi:hypothetical protein